MAAPGRPALAGRSGGDPAVSEANAVIIDRRTLTRQRLRRGVFKGIVDLQAAINRDLAETNANPKPSPELPIPTPSSKKCGAGNRR